jgi:DNA adenine methylase
LVPKGLSERTYHEPFLGAASLFLAIRPDKAFLSDANPHLVSAYRTIRARPQEVARHLKRLAASDSSDRYYAIRDAYNEGSEAAIAAAQFVYLNRTSFNGIFRVNRAGAYNVPYGYKESPIFPSEDTLRSFSGRLKEATLRCLDYRKALGLARRNSFVYLDPPYPPLNGTSFFAHYTSDRFELDQQEEVAEVARRLVERGCLVMVSNADTPAIRRLYRSFSALRLDVTRSVSCKAEKHSVGELVLRSYP